MNKEPEIEKNKWRVTLTYDKFKDRLREALQSGYPFLI